MSSRRVDERLLERWIELGSEVPWMTLRTDPPFGIESFRVCATVRELVSELLECDRHLLGHAFALDDVCFINLNSEQGADEWLAIKGETVIGNISLRVRNDMGDIDRIGTSARVEQVLSELLESDGASEEVRCSDALDRLPPAARSAVEIVAGYIVSQLEPWQQHLPEIELRETCAEIRRSVSCSRLAAELEESDRIEAEGHLRNAGDSGGTRERGLAADVGGILLEAGVGIALKRLLAGREDRYAFGEQVLLEYERFLRGDVVLIWPPAGKDPSLKGLVGVFQEYADPRVSHECRKARVRLRDGEPRPPVEVEPSWLRFAPEDDPDRLSAPVGWQSLRVWRFDDFELRLYEINQLHTDEKPQLGYEFFDRSYGLSPIFSGTDFRPSPLHAVDSDATAAALLSFLSLRPGDTDADYFAGYTPRQLDWRDARAEELFFIADHLERRASWRRLHLEERTAEAVLAVIRDGCTDDLFEVLDMDVFGAYDVVSRLVEDEPSSELLELQKDLLRRRNAELGGD